MALVRGCLIVTLALLYVWTTYSLSDTEIKAIYNGTNDYPIWQAKDYTNFTDLTSNLTITQKVKTRKGVKTYYHWFEYNGVPDYRHVDLTTYSEWANQAKISAHEYKRCLLKVPVLRDNDGCEESDGGAVGFTLNGTPLWFMNSSTDTDAVATERADSCGGHPNEKGRYHYHGWNEATFRSLTADHSGCLYDKTLGAFDHTRCPAPLIGVAFDSIPIYGPQKCDNCLTNVNGKCTKFSTTATGLFTKSELTDSYRLVDSDNPTHYGDADKEHTIEYRLHIDPPYHLHCFRGTLSQTESLVAASGEPWKQQRRFTLTTLRSFGVGKKSFEENISEEMRFLTEEITSLKGKAFDPCHLFNNATSNVICSVVFGKRYDFSDPAFKRLLSLLNEPFKGGLNMLIMLIPIMAKYSDRSAMIQRRREIKRFLNEHVSDHKKDRVENAPRDYIDVYLDEVTQRHKSNPDSAVNETNLPNTLQGLFAAGTETTSTTLRWAMLYMATYPEIQTRIQEELDSVTGRNRLPQLSDKPEVPFTWATVLEVQRIASIAPLGVPHMCSEDTDLGPFTIPKGAIVFANLWAIHHDPDIWPSPDEFKPERFLDGDGNLKEKDELIPFSIGRRICLGEHLAKMELYIFFTHLLHQFTIKMPKDSPPMSMEGVYGLTHSPEPFLVEFIPRE